MTSRRRFLTPDAATGLTACRRLSIPVELIAHVTGALYEMTLDYRWEQHGTMTTDEAVELCKAMFVEYLESNCMIGSVHEFAGALPGNVLPCDGSTYHRADYPELYANLGATWIIDADHFQVPDIRGRVVVGAGAGAGLTTRTMGDAGGEEAHQLTTGEIPAHTHSSHYHVIDIDVEGDIAGFPQTTSGPFGANPTGSTGGDGSHENMQPFVVLQFGIVCR